MPSQNVVRNYVEGGVYHVYNRGVERRVIFADTQDYVVFRNYLKSYLLAPGHPSQKSLPRALELARDSYRLYQRLELLAYCLMPNHFHLVLRQLDDRGMPEFVKRISNGYVRYFNFRYRRVGALFQGAYRAVLAEDGDDLLYLTRYLHRNPLKSIARQGISSLEDYPYSSYAEYLGRRTSEWLHPEQVLLHFSQARPPFPDITTYQQFVEDERLDDEAVLGGKLLEPASEEMWPD